MTNEEMKDIIIGTFIQYDATVSIRESIPFVLVEFGWDTLGHYTYFSQGEDAQDLLAEAERAASKFDTTLEAAIVYLLDSSAAITPKDELGDDQC